MNEIAISKRLSYVLRHRPDSIGISLTADGWVGIDTLLTALAAHGSTITRDQLNRVVAGNDKQRFSLDGDRIRANQGHSTPVDLRLPVLSPPDVLYHGTATRHLPSIRRDGLVRGRRHHVHLSVDVDTAHQVGSRHGRAVVVGIDAQGMSAAGHTFHRSDNGVWLTQSVPPTFLRYPDPAS